jgi:hypothetical protein
MTVSFVSLLPPAALALALSLGFLGAGAMVMQLPTDVLATRDAASSLPPEDAAEPPAPPAPPRYVAMRDPIIVAQEDINGRLRVEMGVSAEDAQEEEVRAVLRDDFAPMQARLAQMILELAASIEIADPGKFHLREALPGAARTLLNDHFEALGHGRPIREVFIVSYASR